MNDLVIKTHNFEAAKRGLKEFAQKQAEDLDIDTVRTGGGFLGLGDHKVTGYELNPILGTIQQHLIDLNSTNNKTIKEFGQVYSALEALDKDYIQAILVSIKATEITSERIEATQEQIKKIVDDQKKTLEVLKKFKQKLDNYAHLEDIDKIWNDCQKWHKETTTISSTINNAITTNNANAKKIAELKVTLKSTIDKVVDYGKCLNQQIAQIEFVIAFTHELGKVVHLHDIDKMWDSLSNAHKSLSNICNDLDSIRTIASKQQADIEILLKFTNTISSYSHLHDIDDIWNKTESHTGKLDSLFKQSEDTLELVRTNQKHINELAKYKKGLCNIVHLNDVDELWTSSEVHSSKLSELGKQNEEISNIIQNNKKLIDAAIVDTVEKNDTAVQMLTKKIKYVYLLAGGSLGLALIELVVILLKVA